MLLTYEQFAEIPTKRHIFYEEAFNALFKRHDATKAQFVRKTYANLALDDFRSFFAAFCAFSYFEEKFSYLDNELHHYVGEAVKFNRFAVKEPNDLIRDLHECVCMLQKDGIHTTFVHRSFQEYFTSAFLGAYDGPILRNMIEKCARRGRDEVLPMLFEMARDKLDRQWAIPRIDKFLGDLSNPTDKLTAATEVYITLVDFIGVEVTLGKSGRLRLSTPMGGLSDDYEGLAWLFKLYAPIPMPQSGRDPMFQRIIYQCFMDALSTFIEITKNRRFYESEVEDKLSIFENVGKTSSKSGSIIWNFNVRMNKKIAEKIGLFETMQLLACDLKKIKTIIENELSSRDSIVSLLVQGVDGPPVRRSRAKRPRSLPMGRIQATRP